MRPSCADKPGNHGADPRRLHIRSSDLGSVSVECILRERNTTCACFFFYSKNNSEVVFSIF